MKSSLSGRAKKKRYRKSGVNEMLTIALDEQGDFEGVKKDGKPMFIGGMIYDDFGNENDTEIEKKRIELYLKAVCKSVGGTYPVDLHVNEGNDQKVKEVKTKISETFGSFLKHGSYKDIDEETKKELKKLPKREGKYYVFSLVKDGKTSSKSNKADESILVREDYASNLYVRMAEEIVERIVFHNPVIENIENVRFDLATRRVVLTGEDRNVKAEEYLALGYKEDQAHSDSQKRTFLLTNGDIYRTALEREMLDSGKNEIHVNRIGVKSIYYGATGNNQRMAFLYLADIVCSLLGFHLNQQNLLEEMTKRANSYTGHEENLIFVYDKIDTMFKKAWNFLEQKQYYEALCVTYQAMQSGLPGAEYYRKVWFARLVEKMQEDYEFDSLGIALRKYNNSTRRNNLDQGELVFIYENFERMIEKNAPVYRSEREVRYDLYDAGVSAYCHIGDGMNAERCFEKCMEYAKDVDIERYLRTRNKMVVYLTDRLEFQKAHSIAQDNKIYQEELRAIRELLFDREEASTNYGIALSQLGQICTSMGNEEAEEHFLAALEQFETAKESDYLQTLSYLLHYYLETDNQEKYEEWIKVFLGGKEGLGEQLKYLISQGVESRFAMSFALYVFVKGIYKFYLDILPAKMLNKLYNIENTIKQIGGKKGTDQIRNHPWEIIYKYLALIALKKGNAQQAEIFKEKIRSVLTYHEFTLDVICAFGEAEILYEAGDEEAFGAAMDETLELIKKYSGAVYEKLPEKENKALCYPYIKQHILNFMYS